MLLGELRSAQLGRRVPGLHDVGRDVRR
jgi:hypothetical protein